MPALYPSCESRLLYTDITVNIFIFYNFHIVISKRFLQSYDWLSTKHRVRYLVEASESLIFQTHFIHMVVSYFKFNSLMLSINIMITLVEQCFCERTMRSKCTLEFIILMKKKTYNYLAHINRELRNSSYSRQSWQYWCTPAWDISWHERHDNFS